MTGLWTAILFVYQQEFHEEINSKNNDVERLTKILQHEPKSPGGPRQYGRYESPQATQKVSELLNVRCNIVSCLSVQM